jgi:hypothetical protein
MENTEENRKKTRKIQNKSKLKSDKIWKIRKKSKSNSENDMEIMEETQVE